MPAASRDTVAGETPITLAPRADHRYRIDVVWRQSGAAHVRDVAGVIIRERAGAVTDWRAFEPASYGTDAGTGGTNTAGIGLRGMNMESLG